MKKYFVFFIVLGLAIGGVYFSPKISGPTNPVPIEQTKVTHSSNLFDPNFFTQSEAKAESYKKAPISKVIGGIIPHHLVAAPLISGFFDGIKNQQIETVILISPNHYQVGPYRITTSLATWTTIFGDLETDPTKVENLVADKTASVYEEMFENEHGIYGLTPFIKKTFPNAKLVPIAITGGTTKEFCDQLAESLVKIIDEKTLVLVSSDFSHYLSSDEADKHDQITVSAIQAFATDQVFHLDHTKNTDSPESIYTLLKIMQLKNATQFNLLANTNSAKLTRELDTPSTTSYVTAYFSE